MKFAYYYVDHTSSLLHALFISSATVIFLFMQDIYVPIYCQSKVLEVYVTEFAFYYVK